MSHLGSPYSNLYLQDEYDEDDDRFDDEDDRELDDHHDGSDEGKSPLINSFCYGITC